MYNSAALALIGDDDFLRELDYYLGEVSSPLFQSFIEAIKTKALMMKLCGRWAGDDEARIRHLLKVWSMKFLEKTYVQGQSYGYGTVKITFDPLSDSDGGESNVSDADEGNDSEQTALSIEISSIGENTPMGGCVIISSGKESTVTVDGSSSIIRDFDDYQEEILATVTGRELRQVGIETSNMTVTFYGYDFAWYHDSKFMGVVETQHFS